MRIFIYSICITFAFSCLAKGNDLPYFQDFAVTNIFKGKSAAVDLTSDPEAHHYRTMLRRQAAEGPDFAGHYKIAIWGCGSECEAFAIEDSKTGKVYFSRELPYVSWTGWEGTNEGLDYRINSKLLILHGRPEEKPQIGIFYYVWDDNKLRLIRSDLQK